MMFIPRNGPPYVLDGTCQDCTFYEKGTQTCRRLPPRVGEDETAVWPMVVPSRDWCAEFLDNEYNDSLISLLSEEKARAR